MAKDRGRIYINFLGFLILGSIGMLMTTNQSLFGYISEEFGRSIEGIGVFLSLVGAGLLISSLIGGELSHRYGKKKILVSFSIISALGLMITALSHAFFLTISGLFLTGFGFGTMESQICGAMADVNPKRVSRILNLSNVCLSVGALLAPLLITSFLYGAAQWRTAYFVLASLYGTIGGLLLFTDIDSRKTQGGSEHLVVPEGEAAPVQPRGLVSVQLMKNPQFLILLIMLTLYVGAESATSWTKSLFSETARGQLFASVALSLFWGVTAASRSINAVFGQGKLRHQLLLAFMGLAAFGMVGIVFSRSDIVRMIFYGIAGFGCGPIWPSLFALGMERDKRYTGIAGGIMLLAGGAGGSLVPLLLGGVSVWFGSGGVFALSAVLLVLIAGLNAVYLRSSKKET